MSYNSNEAEARRVIHCLRPKSVKNGLGPAVVNYYLKESLPKRWGRLPSSKWKLARDYKVLRGEAEHYRPPFIPDLCEFYGDDSEIIIYEIEDKLAIPERKFLNMQRWIDITMDGWAQWHLLVITTNRHGLGWDIALDTKSLLRDFWLSQLRNNRNEFLRTYPDLYSSEIIEEACQWYNWTWPTLDEFNAARIASWQVREKRSIPGIPAWEMAND